jgi:hypothetical protein
MKGGAGETAGPLPRYTRAPVDRDISRQDGCCKVWWLWRRLVAILLSIELEQQSGPFWSRLGPHRPTIKPDLVTAIKMVHVTGVEMYQMVANVCAVSYC